MKQPIKKFISESKIQKRIKELGMQISDHYSGKELILLSILKGSYIFTADLSRNISIPFLVNFTQASSYGKSKVSNNMVQIKFLDQLEIQNKDVLIIEDIIDTGATIQKLINLLSILKPNSIQICSLLIKKKSKHLNLPIAFHGFEIDDEFVVGYGLDYAEKYRNLKYLGVLKN